MAFKPLYKYLASGLEFPRPLAKYVEPNLPSGVLAVHAAPQRSALASSPEVSLVQFYLYQMDLLTTYRYAQMCSRSTPVVPNGRGQLKVLVLSNEISFEAFLEAILESGRCKKYLFYRRIYLAPTGFETLSVRV